MLRASRYTAAAVFILVAVLPILSLGRAVGVIEAEIAAQDALQTLRDSAARSLDQCRVASTLPLATSQGEIVAYLVSVEPSGFLILSADTRLPMVVAYSGEASGALSLTDEAGIVCAIAVGDLALRKAALDAGLVPDQAQAKAAESWERALTPETAPTAEPATEPVGPLLETPTWSQSSPWNDRCPVDSVRSERSLSGCLATALGQVIAYWRFPERVTFLPSDSYRTRSRGISIDATEANMPDIAYSQSSWRNPIDTTMRDLTWAAGVSVRTDYASEGSGALLVDAAVALAGSRSPLATDVRPGIWGYRSADIKTCVNASWGSPFYESAEAFYSDVRRDLGEGCPTLLCLARAGTRIGHIVVCDGYDPVTQAYHLNLGWGGNADAWYALPDDLPGGYNVTEYGVLNIRPGDADRGSSPDAAEVEPAKDDPVSRGEMLVFPNPSHGPAEFSWTNACRLTTPSVVWVNVFTLAGELVWTSDRQAGDEVAWDGIASDGLPVGRGVYVCVMTVVSGTEIRRVRATLFVSP